MVFPTTSWLYFFRRSPQASSMAGSMVHSMDVEADGPPEVCVVARPEAGTVENSICTWKHGQC